MPEELENTAVEQEVSAPQETEDQLPEKFRGKSVQEIVRAYEALESKLGQMGAELGQLRAALAQREQSRPSDYQERRWSELADQLLVNPEEALKRIVSEVRSEVLAATTTQLSVREQLENFFRANPDLDRFREVVAVIGERVYQQNPHLPFSEVLRITAEQSRAYLTSLKSRLADDREARRRAATTGGGTAREAEPAAAAKAAATESEDEVMAAIRELHEWRKPRMNPFISGQKKEVK